MTDQHVKLVEMHRQVACAARETADAITALLAERDELRNALRELVACKDLRDRIDAAVELDGTYMENSAEDYARRKPLAWIAARKALA